MSKASTIALALHARVSNIRVTNGYNTDIGRDVRRGVLTFDADDVPLTVMIEGEDTVEDQKYADVKLTQRFIFEGHMTLEEAEIANPNDVAHLIIADLKRAVFSSDLTLNGELLDKKQIKYVGRNIGPREDGQARVAASIEIAVTYNENLAEP